MPLPAHGAAPAPVAVARDVQVPTIADPEVTLDIWKRRRARTARLRPVALLVHGGGWHTGDKRQWERSRWAQRLAARGWLVVNANYRLACRPAGTAAAQAEDAALARAAGPDARTRNERLCGHAMRTSIADVRATLRYASSRARSWGGDPGRIVLFGASAGAQLAMIAGSDPRRPRGVRAVVAISPPTDLAWVGARPQLPIHPSAALSIGCEADACPAAWRRASPIRHLRRGVTPATLVFNAGADPITPMRPVRDYVARGRALGIRMSLLTSADRSSDCHGPLPCADVPLARSSLRLFERVQPWLRAHA